MDLLILFVLALPIFISFLFRQRNPKKNFHLPPGPPGLPFVGNLFQLDNSALHLHLWKLSQQFGPLFSLQLGCRKVFVVSSPELAKEVMKTQDLNFCSRPSFLSQKKLSYDGKDLFFSPYDDYWREMRRICVVHLFNKLPNFRPIRESEVSSMLGRIAESAAASAPVDLSKEMMNLTNTIICRVGFGMKCEEKGIERSRFQDLLAENEAWFLAFFVSDYFPALGFVDKLNGSIQRLEKHFRDFDVFYEQLIKEHLDPNRSKTEQEDILDVLLQLLKDPSFKIQLTFDHIKAMLMNVFLGGTETSAASVVWAMTYLMKSPSAMKKAQQEVRDLVGKKGFVNEDDVQQLTYLKAVVKETMRIQPSAPLLLPREVIEDCKLGKYDVPAKTIFYVNAYALGRDPQVWENPEEFYPERFIGKTVDLKGQDFELIPFGAGRRYCPGMNMGLANVELSLVNLLYKFDWKMEDGLKREDIDTDVQVGLVVHKKNHLRLVPSIYNP